MSLEQKLRANVDAGIEHLNKFFPNWHNKINLDILDMKSLYVCVAGQIRTLFIDGDWDNWTDEVEFYNRDFGFDFYNQSELCNNDGDISAGAQYKLLTEIWKEKILQMREVRDKATNFKNLNIGDLFRLPNQEDVFMKINILESSNAVQLDSRAVVDIDEGASIIPLKLESISTLEL